MTDNSILNMVGGEKHINPHYDIKEESANKGFTGIEVNGVRFSNIQEMLVYMDKQRNEIILLEKENAELLCQKNRNKSCYSCANATERCFRNEIGCPCQKYKSYKEENAELKAYNEKLLDGDIEKHNKIVELQNRNGELAGQVASLNRWFSEAKEIIKKFSEFANLEVEYDPEHPQEHTDLWNELCKEAEQFLKEVKE